MYSHDISCSNGTKILTKQCLYQQILTTQCLYQQGLSLLLDAVVQNDSSILGVHLDNLLSVIFPLVSQKTFVYRQQTVVYVGTLIDNNITAHVGNVCNMLPNFWFLSLSIVHCHV